MGERCCGAFPVDHNTAGLLPARDVDGRLRLGSESRDRWHAGVVDTAPEQPSELRRWLERVGLEGAEVLAVLDNADLDQLNREGVRLLHGLLEARWQLEHPEELGGGPQAP
jgi:hypothetical protein